MLLIKNNKKREAALKNEAGEDEKHFFFLLGLIKRIAPSPFFVTQQTFSRIIPDGGLNEPFYLPVFVFLQHASPLNEFLTRFLLYISNRTEQYSAEWYLAFH